MKGTKPVKTLSVSLAALALILRRLRVRTFKDGRLKNDTYSEQRLLGQPPGVSAWLIAFNRFHNYVVGEMALINEAGRFSLPAGLTPKSSQYATAEAKRENDLFQTGRLVTCGLYVNIILGDYLRTILNLNTNPVNSDWKLDPRGRIEVFDAQGVPRGLGNQVCAEFNMIYRWHAAITDQDETWTKAFMKDSLGRDVDPSTLSVGQFLAGLRKWKQTLDPEPSKWTFGGLKRAPDGNFHDSDLVKLLQDGAERAVGAFGSWGGLATLNEFRVFKLKPYATFLEVNSDPEVAEALEALYGHPDNIELFQSASSDFDVASGDVMYKLLMRAFPGYYPPNSFYTLYPFTIPTHNRQAFEKAGGPHTFQLTRHDYMLSGDSTANADQRVFVNKCIYQPKDSLEEVQQYYERTTLELLREYSKKAGPSYYVDAVRDIGNLAHANFTADFFNIPVTKSADNDAYTDAEMYDALAELFGYVFLDVDPAQSLKHRTVGSRKSERLGQVMRKQVEHQQSHLASIARQVLGTESEPENLVNYGAQLVRRLLDDGKSVDEVVWTIIPTAAAAACATQAQGWGQLIDLYLSDAYYKHWPDIQRLAHSNDRVSFEKLKKYALEGFRLSTPAFGVLRNAAVDTTIDDSGKSIAVHKGDTIFADFVTAGRDPIKFPDPESIRLDRADELYIHHGWGPHACLGRAIVTVAGAAMLRVFGRLTNLRRSPGPSGEMKSKLVNNAFKVYLPEDGSEWTPFPCNKKVLFDSLGDQGS
ncbi:heme peroxidase [Aspergillus campestris IBT 28561]|uniref:Heme peroxidase n=1 Tax=Aspergillus campestris (strain IBT 28561) TaxID=1392248 RepID=A0A2I1D3Z4_ASPC2|nr:heme peroxidase [Aspergillus campestris IBT 28561]PKY04594.1 heme peroxidase [Aspergillus campestris IBT 28561]